MDTEKAAEGVNKFLLAPMYLVYDILTALIPGVLFSILLFIKQIHEPFAVLNSAVLGYKTKICVGLLLSYIIGRVFRTPVELLLARYLERELSKITESSKPPHSAADFIQNFLIGALALPQLFKKVQPLDLLVLVFANTVFSFATGIAMIVAALIPGDGVLRIVEAAIGFVMVLGATVGLNGLLRTFTVLLGGLVDIQAVFGPLANISAALKGVIKPTPVPQATTPPTGPVGSVLPASTPEPTKS